MSVVSSTFNHSHGHLGTMGSVRTVSEHPPYESAVDRAIREAAERGAFDDLPGKGRPLPHLDDDELGWVRRWMDREGVSPELLLPPSVQLRKEIDRLPQTLAALRTEAAVREHVREVDLRVVEHLHFPSGPRVPVRRIDADAAVARWRADRVRPGATPPGATPPGAAPPGATPPGPAAAPDRQPGRRDRWPFRRRPT